MPATHGQWSRPLPAICLDLRVNAPRSTLVCSEDVAPTLSCLCRATTGALLLASRLTPPCHFLLIGRLLCMPFTLRASCVMPAPAQASSRTSVAIAAGGDETVVLLPAPGLGTGTGQALGQALGPSPKALASDQSRVLLQESLHSQAWDAILLLWHGLCEFIAPLSQVVQELAASPSRKALTLKLLQVSDSTVSRYLSSCLSFFAFATDLGLGLEALTQVQAVEAILALRLSKHQDSGEDLDAATIALVHPVNTLKALRWLAKVSLLRFPDTYSGFFRALTSGPMSDRKEVLTLPLDCVAFLEALVLDPGSEPVTVAFAGSALALVWASLRFSDASHIRWSTLIYDVSCHVAYRTKTTRRGVTVSGLLIGFGLWTASGSTLSLLAFPLARTAFSSCQMRLALALARLTWLLPLHPMPLPFAPCVRLWPCGVALTRRPSTTTRCTRPRQRLCPGHLSWACRNFPDGSKDTTVRARCRSMGWRSRIRSGWFPALAQHRGGQLPVVEPPLQDRPNLAAAFLAPPARFLAQGLALRPPRLPGKLPRHRLQGRLWRFCPCRLDSSVLQR